MMTKLKLQNTCVKHFSSGIRFLMIGIRLLTIRIRLLTFAAALSSLAAAAQGTQPLEAFLQKTPAAKISFQQTSLDQEGNVVGETRGRFWYQRPHLFRMEYDPPQSIVMVSDGEQTWTYEPDLQQVIIQSADNLAGASTLLDMLASGSVEGLRRDYIIAANTEDGQHWIDAESRANEQAIRRMRLGFSTSGDLNRIELADSFGSTVKLNVQTVSRDPQDDSLFRFNPPVGVDIVRE